MKLKTLIVIILMFTIHLITVGDIKAQESMIQPGEDLLYEVSFFGVKLGSIRIITEGYQTLIKYQVVRLLIG